MCDTVYDLRIHNMLYTQHFFSTDIHKKKKEHLIEKSTQIPFSRGPRFLHEQTEAAFITSLFD